MCLDEELVQSFSQGGAARRKVNMFLSVFVDIVESLRESHEVGPFRGLYLGI
jgi:hypothetical protein